MKRKQMLLVTMTALLCMFSAGRLWAATAAENLHLNSNVRIESVTKRLPINTKLPVTTEVYFDVKLKDNSNKWEFTGQSVSGDRPYLMLQMPLKGQSVKPALKEGEADTLVETSTAVAYYAGMGDDASTLRFVYKVRPGDMSTNITWVMDGTTAVAIGGKIENVALSVLDTTTGLGVQGGAINLTTAAMKADAADAVTDKGPVIPVSGYTITVGDADNNNLGMLYEGLVPVTVSAIASDAGTRSVLVENRFYTKGYFWVANEDGTKYYKVGATLANDGDPIKEAEYPAVETANFQDVILSAAKISGMNNSKILSQKFFVNIPRGLAGQNVRLCYGVSPDVTDAEGLYAYETYTVEATPVLDVTPGYQVRNANMVASKITLPVIDLLNPAYSALATKEVTGGEVTVGAGEETTFTIAKNAAKSLADYGTLYASIELISRTNDANAEFERYHVPLYTDAASGEYKVKLKVGEVGSAADTVSYFRVRVPGLEAANNPGTVESPFYLKVTASPKRERIWLSSSEVTSSNGTEYYQPIDAAAGQTPGSFNVLEYTLTVNVDPENSRDFLIYPTDATHTHRIDPEAKVNGLYDADGKPVNAYNLIASYVTLQDQGGGVFQNGKPEVRVTIPAGETTAKFYAVCVNDYAGYMGLLNSAVTLGDNVTTVNLGGVRFTAKRCNSTGEIIGKLDESGVITATVNNRAPIIQTASVSSSAATGADIPFTFAVADARGDYLVLTINYGDGERDSVLMVDEAAMAKLMGKAAWDAKLAELIDQYGVGTPKALKTVPRTNESQQYTFKHAYTSGSVQNWNFTVMDSSLASNTTGGTINLETAQLFQFITLTETTAPASGYVLWDKEGDSIDNWRFGTNYTSSSLSKSGGSSLVTVIGKPFSAGDTAPSNRFNGPSKLLDSFFYKWSANSDYETLLPSGADEKQRYDQILSFSRAYVKDGEAANSLAWQDIMLSAIFVSEYLPSDAWNSYDKDLLHPYVYDLGDYNTDGVPDGWLLSNMGAANREALVEGEPASSKSPDGSERLPRAGWGAGDAAYKFGNSLGTSIKGSLALDGVPFGYMMRVRGRDDALNAADGFERAPSWLSIPAWSVIVHPEYVSSDALVAEHRWPKYGLVKAGELTEDDEFVPAWTSIRLYPGTGKTYEQELIVGEEVDYTENGIPYNPRTTREVTRYTEDGVEVIERWAHVIDWDGNTIAPVESDTAIYTANSVRVCISPNSANYEAFEYTYKGWMMTATTDRGEGWVNNRHRVMSYSTDRNNAVLFPFTLNAEADQTEEYLAAVAGPLDEATGAKFYDKYYYVDKRGTGGMLIDEPFKKAFYEGTGYISPVWTSWLDRFPVAGAADPSDSDGDGIKNAAEYYFWYYASRIVYGSVYYQWAKDKDGKPIKEKVDPDTVQLNTALWPAIDLRKRHHNHLNTDGFYRTTELFTMGRRYINAYDPYLIGKSYYGVPEYNAETNAYELPVYTGNASVGKGNYWEPISALEVMDAFNPLASNGGHDLDNDGLNVAEELAIGTNPIDCDSDNDWMLDGWEVAYGLDPLNIVDQQDPNDAEKNPDKDYFAFTTVSLYPDYHHLIKVDYQPAGQPLPPEMVAYYDHEASAVRIFDAETLKSALEATNFCKEADIMDTIAWADARSEVEQWYPGEPIYMRGNPEFKFLRDFEVYRAFGFNSKTAVGGGTNTKPFTSRDEFNSAVKRGDPTRENGWMLVPTSPVSADTNGDGVPDGWSLYTGMKPYNSDIILDGARDPDGDGLTTTQEYAHNAKTGWTNKTAPTDPWNPDTDFDGLWDGEEGLKYLYGMPLPPENAEGGAAYYSYIVGGGCNPNSLDTDGDGMSDAWEFHYGRAPISVTAAATEGDVPVATPDASEEEEEGVQKEEPYAGIAQDDKRFTYSINGVKIVYSEAPDPTRSGVDDNKKRMSDYDLDPDRDGLTNLQEYQIAGLRHVRYDLGPDMARIYAETAGELQPATVSAKGLEWKTLPDAYATAIDLANPTTVVSMEFCGSENVTVPGGANITYFMEETEVPLLAQSIAVGALAFDRAPPQNPPQREMIKGRYADAITNAFNYNWNSTIAFPTKAELADYGLTSIDLEDKDLEANPALAYAADRLITIADLITELDMAWMRLLTVSNQTSSQEYAKGGISFTDYTTVESMLENYDATNYRNRNERQVRILIHLIDELIAKIQKENLADLQPVMVELFKDGGDTIRIWTARKEQILKALVFSFYGEDSVENVIDPAYRGDNGIIAVSDAWALEKGKEPYRDSWKAAVEKEYSGSDMAAYEEAVRTAANPLIRSRYRAAMRGLNGGFWNDVYTPTGWHGAMKPFSMRKAKAADSKGTVLGVIINATERQSPLGADDFPGWSSSECNLLVTNPLTADTDFDGMDDYYEIFHGLNPVLGDYVYDAWEDFDSSGKKYTGVDRLATAVCPSGDSDYVLPAAKPHANAFDNPAPLNSAVTGYDYYTYPWMAGTPFADPDGDGLLNSEEAVNPVTSEPARYGTDPSALWMTDISNKNSIVSRFYTRMNPQWKQGVEAGLAPKAIAPYVKYMDDEFPGSFASTFAYEINEGYDTDGDGVGDLVELTSKTVHRGDPQALRTPDRQQAAYFGGKGVMQTMADANFGPQMLTTFTIECWVKPAADNADEVVLIDRPWRFNEATTSTGVLRHNFVLGLRKQTQTNEKGASITVFRPFAYYTGSGTNTDGSESTPKSSPEVVAGQSILPDEWTHVAVTYDGARLALILNGVESESQTSTLIPANGIISVKSTPESDIRRFTYRKAPIMIGAAPSNAWFAELGDPEDETTFEEYFAKCYKGYIDEVRIWNGARSSAQIAEARARTLTQVELLTFRATAFNERLNGLGYFQTNTSAEPLAIYTFNDLLAGSRILATETEEAKIADVSWERFPGDKTVGDDTVPGSFMYRRKGFRETVEAAKDVNHPLYGYMPKEEELFTSYYTQTAAKNLRSKQYAENRATDTLTLLNGAEAPISEFVPLAHNTVAHLPLADVQRASVYNYTPYALVNGSPALATPSGDMNNLKVANSAYWSPYRAGPQVGTDAIYSVKTTGNPYGYMYYGTTFFDVPTYSVVPAYTTQTLTDLLIYGDVYARYDAATWDGSPATDPAAGTTINDDGSGSNTVVQEASADWFRHQDTPNKDSGSKLNDKQYSQGAYWLEQNIAIGQTKDSDGDRMPNWWENYYALDPEVAIGKDGPHGDQDGDFLTNYAEFLASANPQKYSTVGNGVSDFHIPMWFRRGAPTFGTLYTDNDFMEDHWEASNRHERLSVDLFDAHRDADGDGWSNFAEARANFRSGYHSTNPNAETSISQTGRIKLEMPTPALRMTVDYFGNQNVYTNATAEAKIVVHAYTAKNNNSAPDATFKLPLAAIGEAQEQATIDYEVGEWKRGKMSGYLHVGNIVPGSLKVKFTRMAVDKPEDDNNSDVDFIYFNILSDTKTVGELAELYYMEPVYWVNEEGETVANGYDRRPAGTVNYRTGEFVLDFSDKEMWPDQVYYQDEKTKELTYYNRSEFVGVATYKYGVVPGRSNTYTLVNPDEGHLKEGLNNFFVFADFDADGKWDDGEPAGIPDQHDIEIGFDQVNEVLHVTLTQLAPPGTVRVDVDKILGVLTTENQTNNAVTGDYSSILNPSTGDPLNPSLFTTSQNYWICLRVFENIGQTTTTENPGLLVFEKQFNVNKPYLTEDEILGNAKTSTGLPGSEAENQTATSYKVYLIPETQRGAAIQAWTPYNIAVVTNNFGMLDADSTSIVAPVGGALLHNSDITFEWKCNVQVPAFGLKITKVADGAGNAVNKVVYENAKIRGVAPSATAKGTGAVEQFVYRYKLPRGVGELNANMNALFGDGSYTYELALSPYAGSAKTLEGDFKIQLNASGDKDLSEIADADTDSNYNMQDSYYVRAQVRYNGVLKDKEDFDYRRFVVEAHYSGSFNGNPVASTSDKLGYDADSASIAALNRCVKMVKDKTDGEFFSTRFDIELRGLSTNAPVYLMAYFDLNGNGKRDIWEPWGYATQGLDAVGGFYFDPRPITPVSNGIAWNAEFYIQDVDSDSDKLADAWEWLANGKKDTASFFADETDGSGWCNVFTGTLNDLSSSAAIWVTDVNGQVAMSAYGAQLYGLTVEGEPDANGAVKIKGVEDMAAAKELLEILGNEAALSLLSDGISTYGLTVDGITFTGDAITLTWGVDSAVGTDGSVYDLTPVFAKGKNYAAKYAVYGTATLGGKWTKLAEVKVAGELAPAVEISAADALIDGTEQATFFKVILSATQLEETIE